MSYNNAYWLFAYALTSVTLILAVMGVRAAKSGDLNTHMARMNQACGLILFFVATYVVKVLVLGREDKSDWSTWRLVVLYTHEAFIGLMLGAGGYARFLAAKIQPTLGAVNLSDDDRSVRFTHKRAGKVAMLAVTCALVTATGVLYGLFFT